MSYLVAVTSTAFHNDAKALLENKGFEVVWKPMPTQAEMAELLREADAHIAGSEPLGADILSQAAKLKVIARVGVGYDAVDCRYAAERGIPVTITLGANEQSVADLVFAHLLGLARRLPEQDRSVRAGGWSAGPIGTEVWSKTIGIVGTGRIGKAVARRAAGFDMRIVAYDPYPDAAWAESNGIRYVELDRLLAESDVVTLHTPATSETVGMVNGAFLGKMKPTAFLINTARGTLVDEEALYEALSNGMIAGAGLDVFREEPLPAGNKLTTLGNCLLTSHIASHTEEALRRMCVMSAEEVVRVLGGDSPRYPVPLPAAVQALQDKGGASR
ncbi:phosphoglycerate dehydrogenase [Paenibacillus koleovorans]|uniref:phosphoglycerate dehydrogenase n=1 Tax=Paenibacillus koleovorans TaxID=121608 RepID=UPI000FDB454F|nr:phosphoglycerate dehydrogenase [Paenibacillus koleovorans]